MADLQLTQYISDTWYEVYRSNIDSYINHFGQKVRLIKRTGTTYNQYSDILKDVATAITVSAIISKHPFEGLFLSPPLNYNDEPDMSQGFIAYFSRDSLVRLDDIVILEGKSIEGDVELEAFEVLAIKGKRLEQEFIRKYMLAPIRDSNPMFENASILTTDTLVEDHSVMNDVNGDPGGWSKDYYVKEIIVPTPGTEGYIDKDKTLNIDSGPFEEMVKNIYDTNFPENWLEGQPYDIGVPIKK